MVFWTSGVLVVFWTSGGVLVFWWCSNVLAVFWWCSSGVLVFWCSVGAQKHGGLKKIHVASIASSWNSSYFLKFFLTSYSPYRLFSAFRSI